MKMFRKYTAGALLLVMILVVAACGNSDNNAADTPGNDTTNEGTTN